VSPVLLSVIENDSDDDNDGNASNVYRIGEDDD